MPDPFDDLDQVLCHCDGGRLRAFVESLEGAMDVQLVRPPSLCLTMIRSRDSLEGQEFFLGEALTTECEVEVGGVRGLGLCLGEEPVRAYCIAVFDALREAGPLDAAASAFVDRERAAIAREQGLEIARVLETRVDFKLLEQE